MDESGAVMSTVKLTFEDLALSLPAASRALALTVWVASASGIVTVTLQLPAALAVVVPALLPFKNKNTVLLASAVPVKVGRAEERNAPAMGLVTTGTAGGVVSRVHV